MMDGFVRTDVDKEKARSILKMAKTTLEMIKSIDEARFPSNLVKEYYDVIRELVTAVLLLDGVKTYGEGAHKNAIEYLGKNYSNFTEFEVTFLDKLRMTRNRISYNGFFVTHDFYMRKKQTILSVVKKLESIIESKL